MTLVTRPVPEISWWIGENRVPSPKECYNEREWVLRHIWYYTFSVHTRCMMVFALFYLRPRHCLLYPHENVTFSLNMT